MNPSHRENSLDETVNEQELPDLFYEKGQASPEHEKIDRNKAFAVIGALVATLFFLPLNYQLSGIARVEAEHNIIVEAIVPGELKEIDVKEGDLVKRGDKIGLIYDRINELELIKAQDERKIMMKRFKILKNRAAFLKKKLEKSAHLYLSDAVTASDKDTAEFDYHQALQEMNVAETELSSLLSKIRYLQRLREIGTVRAPIDGMIFSKISHLAGTYFDKGDKLLEMGDMNNVLLELPVYESQLRRIRKGQKVDLRFYAYPEKRMKGRVVDFHPTAYEKIEKVWVKENVINVLIKLNEKPPFDVRSGMTAKVSIHCKGQSLFTQLRSKFI